MKSLRTIKNTIVNDELGYNISDNCEYIDYEDLGKLTISQSDLRVVQINIRGIKSKLDELDMLITDLNQPDIIIINETWLKSGEDKFINIKGYTFEGTPRERKKGGGVGFSLNMA